MEEFGYKVSKDYEKLKDIIFSHCFDKRIVGFIYDNQGKRQVVKIYHGLTICDKNSGAVVIGYNCNLFLRKKGFLTACKRHNLTFIDPDPPNPNAIFYADGSEVQVGDKVEITSQLIMCPEDGKIGVVKFIEGGWNIDTETELIPCWSESYELNKIEELQEKWFKEINDRLDKLEDKTVKRDLTKCQGCGNKLIIIREDEKWIYGICDHCPFTRKRRKK